MSRASRLKVAELEAARARFAKANVFNLTEPLIQDNDVGHAYDAALRLRSVMGLGNDEESNNRVAHVLGELVELMQNSEMTINFNAIKWFNPNGKLDPFKLKSYINVWQAREMISTNLGQGRVDAEKRMFQYDKGVVGDRAEPGSSQHMVSTSVADHGTANVGEDMLPTNENFNSSMRPGYAALNVGAHAAGAARFYTLSCMVLQHCIRFNSTFSHRDSVNKSVSQESLCSYLHLFKIIERCDKTLLEKMIARVEQTNLQPFSANSTNYIEAQLHTDILFDRDVTEMRVLRVDFDGAGALKDVKATSRAKAALIKFTSKNGISLQWHNGA